MGTAWVHLNVDKLLARPQEPPTSGSFITKGVNSYFYPTFSHVLLLVAKHPILVRIN